MLFCISKTKNNELAHTEKLTEGVSVSRTGRINFKERQSIQL